MKATILKISGLFIFLLAVISASAQDRAMISGKIISTEKETVDFATVYLKGTTYGGTTNEQGIYHLKAPAGDYTLVVSAIGYKTVEKPVKLTGGERTRQNITITPQSTELDEVVVVSNGISRLKRSAFNAVALDTKELQNSNKSLSEALAKAPGMKVRESGGVGSDMQLTLDGFSGKHVKIFIDGVPQEGVGSSFGLNNIPVNFAERIEIYKGVVPVGFGTDAIGGVINIITKKGDGYSEENTWRVGARVQEESMGKEYDFFKDKGLHNESIDLGFNHKSGLFVNGGYTRNNHGGWQGDLTGREKRWHPKDQALMNGMFGFQNRNMNVWYRLDFLDEKIFGPNNGSELQPEKVSDKDFLTKRYTHQLQSDWKLDNRLDVHAALSYQDYKRRTRTTESDLSTGEKWLSSAEASQDITQYKAWIARATVAWNIAPEFSVQPGVEYQWTQGEGGRIDGTPKVSDLAFFLSAEYKPWEWLSLRPGVRTFIVADYDAPIAIPSVLTKFKLTKHMDLRLSYAYGFRSPTLQELYFSFHNDNHDIDGNPDLKAEYSHNITGSVAYRVLHSEKIHLTTTLSGFYNDFRDKISLAQNVDIPNYNTYYNIDRYKTVGGSLENSLSWGGLRANLNVSLIGRYNRYATGDKSMPRFRYSPEVSTSISYHIEKTGTDISLFYKYTGERKEYYYHEYTTADNKKESEIYLRGMKSYHTGDLTVTQKLTSFLHLNAGVKNLFNLTSLKTIAESPNDTPSVSYLGCGRSWSVGLSFLLNGKFN